ncbi:hypothetical protein [Pedobacter cryoconitis]|uniref:DUF4836 family protein n=1 Tax=Pedobacter cryoconitis TaxID=188932 RepID=A0A7X0J0T3_9SPHI|nr:hypothetical protein [Pedobacter cryoconitis]MBB6498713.1 hypothetical protein [Pedobacter cryoconitis]
MKNFYKYVISAVFTFSTLAVSAQNLASKIPSDALIVVTLKGDNLTRLMSVKEFNNTFVGKEITDKLAGSAKGNFKTIEDFGFNLSSTFYYYNRGNDSVSYNCVLAPVKNAGQLDQLFNGAEKSFTQNGKLRTFYSRDSTEVMVWNEEIMLFVKSDGKESYFSRPDVSKRLGLTTPFDPTVIDTVQAATAATDSAVVMTEPVIQEPVVPKKTITRKSQRIHVKNKKRHVLKRKPAKKKTIQIEEPRIEQYAPDSTAYATADTARYSETIDTALANSYLKNDRIKKAETARWTKKMISGYFEKSDQSSILTNKDFIKSIDQKAEATVWISNAVKLMNTYVPGSYLKGINILNGYGSANIKLYLEKSAIRMRSEITFSNEMAAVFRKLNKRKLNRKFFNYINEDKLIGYMGYAMDSKAYLEEYPKLMSKMYDSVYKDEVALATDLFSLLVDEEAVSKVIKGDGLFVFNGLSQKDKTYQTYEYNEQNFETKTVTKTKKETLPDFLLMVSTEDTRLINKLIAYGVKKNAVKDQQNYYELAISKSPMPLYFTIQDGIIFLGTNADEMKQIANHQYHGNLSGRHKKILSGSNFAAYFSAKKLAGKIPAEEIGNPEKLAKTNKVLSSLGDIYIKSDPINGNVFSGEISMDTPAQQQNALKYLFSIIDDTRK